MLADAEDRACRILDRQTLLSRRAAGTDARRQLIAANVDTLLITTSCTDDFNPARLERYLALAHQAGSFAVVVISRADLVEDPAAYRRAAERLAAALPVVTLDARDAAAVQREILPWCGHGRTAALVGMSGTGKTTLANALTGAEAMTGEIREDDARGRHTTTARALRRMVDGGWLIDTPGMRALRLTDTSEGIDAVFADIAALAEDCRFRDCAHEEEPGCAVQAAIAAGDLGEGRLARWRKLQLENARNSWSLAQSRAAERAFARQVRAITRAKPHRK